MGDIHNTQFFRTVQDNKLDVSEVLEQVYAALTEKGYNPVSQIVGYIMSGDPTYITSHKNARRDPGRTSVCVHRCKVKKMMTVKP